MEAGVRAFAVAHPEVQVSTLRLADVLGTEVRSPLVPYLCRPVWPTPLGYDARLQFLHQDDALEVLRRAAVEGLVGTFNVAGEGVLLLSQAARRASRPTVPLPRFLGGWLAESLALTPALSEDQLRFLSYGRVMDCSRLHAAGFRPRSSTATFDDFVERRAGRLVTPVLLDEAERRARELLGDVERGPQERHGSG